MSDPALPSATAPAVAAVPAAAAVSPAETLQRLRAGRLFGATRLDLRGCGLEDLPPEVLTLGDSLQTLDLSANRLDRLPEGLARLTKLETLFCSDNHFTRLPPVLGRCARLDIVGFKANQIADVPAEALPHSLRWLILTDNSIDTLPDSIGQCTRLQKLMLAGNRLRALPATLAQCRRLELLRIAANHFETVDAALPDWLLALPRLAWLAHAGNPFSAEREAQALQAQPIPLIAWSQLQVQAVLGAGASGVIHAASWQTAGGAARPVAVKLFKGAVTSDGLPRSEMAACIAAGEHPHIVGVEGRVHGHPDGIEGLVLRIIPPRFRNLAGPPSFASCTRDVYPEGLRLSAAPALRIARGIRSALSQLHERGLVHGDLYAHNILVDEDGDSLLGDFGAASFLPADAPRRAALQRLDRRAFGWLVDELAQHCDDPAALDVERG